MADDDDYWAELARLRGLYLAGLQGLLRGTWHGLLWHRMDSGVIHAISSVLHVVCVSFPRYCICNRTCAGPVNKAKACDVPCASVVCAGGMAAVHCVYEREYYMLSVWAACLVLRSYTVRYG